MNKILSLLITIFSFSSCSLDNYTNPDPKPKLTLINSYQLTVEEPSDLCYDKDTNSLWTVSDADCKVYNIDFEGNVLGHLPFVGDDLEGIAYSPKDSTLWLAEEHLSQIVKINKQGQELERKTLPVQADTNSGLEGITLDDLGNIYVVKEKTPGMFLKVSPDFVVLTQEVIDFAGDFAAISYNSMDGNFWVVSDQNEAIYVWNLEDGVMAEYNLPFSKPEGIAYVPLTDTFYFVSDSLNELYEMKLQVVGDIE